MRRILRISTTAAALFPAAMHAQDVPGASPPIERSQLNIGGGVFVGYQFGSSQNVEWGVEGFLTRINKEPSCSSEARSGYGPLLQVALLGFGSPRITLAAHGGAETARGGSALTGELGVSYRFGRDPGFGIHLGVVPEVALFNVALRYQLLRNEAWVGGGVRLWPTYGEPGSCVVGRPLRTDAGVLSLQTDEALANVCAAELAALGFAHDAQLEAASVSAFLQLALELLALGAPTQLIDATLTAACDEIEHAQLCAALATRTLSKHGQHVPCVLPPIATRSHIDETAALCRLAQETWSDGCLGEASAARQAASAADCSSDLATAQVLRRIAVDEANHGELAWSVLDFCIERGGEAVRATLREQRSAHTAAALHQPCAWLTAPHGLARYGRLPARRLAQLQRAQRTDSQQRLG
ncbi:MAG: hypothetical protein RL701_5915, partial [Pseudomonadota bacterium]